MKSPLGAVDNTGTLIDRHPSWFNKPMVPTVASRPRHIGELLAASGEAQKPNVRGLGRGGKTYDKVFSQNQATCLLYTGGEDGVPFPGGVDPSGVDDFVET